MFRVPSFIVTLAGLIGWQGVLLYVLGEGGTRNITDSQILALTDTFFSTAAAWTIGIVLIGLMIVSDHLSRLRRIRAGLVTEPLAVAPHQGGHRGRGRHRRARRVRPRTAGSRWPC